jgi:hypothetical protein
VATLVFSLTSLALVACGAYDVGIRTLSATLVLAVIALPAIRAQCKRYAVAQVRAILSDSGRAAVVKATLVEVAGEEVAQRRAA